MLVSYQTIVSIVVQYRLKTTDLVGSEIEVFNCIFYYLIDGSEKFWREIHTSLPIRSKIHHFLEISHVWYYPKSIEDEFTFVKELIH